MLESNVLLGGPNQLSHIFLGQLDLSVSWVKYAIKNSFKCRQQNDAFVFEYSSST